MKKWLILCLLFSGTAFAQSNQKLPPIGGIETECNIFLQPKLQESFRNFRMGPWEFHPKPNGRALLVTPIAASVDGYSYFSVIGFCWLTQTSDHHYAIDFTRPGVYGYEVDQ